MHNGGITEEIIINKNLFVNIPFVGANIIVIVKDNKKSFTFAFLKRFFNVFSNKRVYKVS